MSDWKTICAKCAEGEIEPRECEYYGEPNGCNSPTYQAHPPVGNAAKLREALVAIKEVNDTRPHDAKGNEINDIITEALVAPPRNCDRFENVEDAKKAFEAAFKNKVGFINFYKDTFDWLFATAEPETKGATDGK